MTARPVIDIPDEVAEKYKNATPEIIAEASREAAAAALAGAMIGIAAHSGELMETAEIVTMALEQAHDTMALELGDEHADIWLNYIANQTKALGDK